MGCKVISSCFGRVNGVEKETSKRNWKLDKKIKRSSKEKGDKKESIQSMDDDRQSEDGYDGGRCCDQDQVCACEFPCSPSFKIYVTFPVDEIDDAITIDGKSYTIRIDDYVEVENPMILSTSNNEMPKNSNSQPQESMSSFNSTQKGVTKSPKRTKLARRIGRVLAKRKGAASIRNLLSIKTTIPAVQDNPPSSTRVRFIHSRPVTEGAEQTAGRR
ncbi:hypothetical protein Ancab_026409 [Ancistrocladus abbreviatus]